MVKSIDPEVVRLNSRVFAGRLKLNEVLNRAHVPRSTWWRWVQRGAEPRRATVGKIDQAIDVKLTERELSNGD